MQYRTIKKTNEKLSALGYGCMRLPTKNGTIDTELAKAQIRHAIDNGVNYLDTAYNYHAGASESFLGKHILTDGYREKVNIATKMPCFLVNTTAQFESLFEKQRKKLGVEVIDYYLLHTLDGQTFKKMLKLGVIDFMNKLKAEGKIRYMGFSFHDKYENFIPILEAYDWDFCQVQFNIIDEQFQAGIKGIQAAAEKGIGVFIMEPLRGGSLVGRLPKQITELYDQAEIKKTPADWALRWILNHPEVTLVLSGMNDYQHIDENIQTASSALENNMTKQELDIIKQVKDKFDQLVTIKCTGCQYCINCPAKIDIPSAFKHYNDYTLFHKNMTKILYALSAGVQSNDGKPYWATGCVDCGACEKNCPQNLPIRQHLKQVTKTLETPGLKIAAAIARAYYNFRK